MTDLARYALVYFHGGVYADIDVYNYRNLEGALVPCTNGTFVAVTETPSLQQANYFFMVGVQVLDLVFALQQLCCCWWCS